MKFLSTALLVATSAVTMLATPASARHLRHHHHHHHHHYRVASFVYAAPGQPYRIDFLHNYGPGLLPGTFAFYDGPLSVRCKQSAAAYRGQDGRAHSCY